MPGVFIMQIASISSVGGDGVGPVFYHFTGADLKLFINSKKQKIKFY